MTFNERAERAQAEDQAALTAFIGTLVELWGDPAAAARWNTLTGTLDGREEGDAEKVIEFLIDLLITQPIMLDPALLCEIERRVSRLWCYLSWRHVTGRTGTPAETALWTRALRVWQDRRWNTRGRISA